MRKKLIIPSLIVAIFAISAVAFTSIEKFQLEIPVSSVPNELARPIYVAQNEQNNVPSVDEAKQIIEQNFLRQLEDLRRKIVSASVVNEADRAKILQRPLIKSMEISNVEVSATDPANGPYYISFSALLTYGAPIRDGWIQFNEPSEKGNRQLNEISLSVPSVEQGWTGYVVGLLPSTRKNNEHKGLLTAPAGLMQKKNQIVLDKNRNVQKITTGFYTAGFDDVFMSLPVNKPELRDVNSSLLLLFHDLASCKKVYPNVLLSDLLAKCKSKGSGNNFFNYSMMSHALGGEILIVNDGSSANTTIVNLTKIPYDSCVGLVDFAAFWNAPVARTDGSHGPEWARMAQTDASACSHADNTLSWYEIPADLRFTALNPYAHSKD